MYASDLKLKILNWLVPKLSQEDCVASELRMLDSKVVADLAIGFEHALIGIEIKSPRDSLRRLSAQAEAYSHMFHATYIAIAENDNRYKSVASTPAINRLGILCIGKDGVDVLRDPTSRPFLEKSWAVRWLLRRQLETLLRSTSIGIGQNTDVEGLRRRAVRFLDRETLNQSAIFAVRNKMRPAHDLFVSELGKVATADDLANLSLKGEIISIG